MRSINGLVFGAFMAFIMAKGCLVNSACAQPADYAVTEQGANYRVWSQTVPQNGSNVVHQYTELATGLNFTNASGQWQPSQEQITLLPTGGAAATNGQHQVYFPADIYNGVLEVVTPDGRHLCSRPLGVSYDDGSNTVFIATLTNAIGQLVGSNQVVYPNAFAGIKADLVMTYRRGGFESDLVFRQQPPTPDQCGLDSSFTTLELVTEFFNTQDPAQIPAASDDWFGLQDSTLKFGALTMTHGKAFALIGTNSNAQNSTSVYKSWVHSGGRTFLVEAVPVLDITENLAALPLQSSLWQPNSKIKYASSHPFYPPAHGLTADTNQILLASADRNPEPSVVLDYTTISGGPTDYTLQAGRTYYVSGYFNADNLTIEPGAVIKLKKTGSGISLNDGQSVDCETTPDRPAIFTAVDDDTVGDVIAAFSTGVPDGYYGDCGLSMSYLDTGTIHDLQFYYQESAFGIFGCGSILLQNLEFHNCSWAVNFGDVAEGPKLNNILVENCGSLLECTTALFGGEITHVTATNVWGGYLVNAQDYLSSDATFKNCLLQGGLKLAEEFYDPDIDANDSIDTSGSSNNGYYAYYTSYIPLILANAAPFQTAGRAQFYLKADSPYRNAGTVSIDSAALTDIQAMTTYAPQDGQHADTDLPDLGYHYPIKGYITDGLVAYWRLNDGSGSTAVDSVGGNNLTLHGSPTWGSAYLTFNGFNQYGDAGNPTALDITGDITICAWVNSASFPTINNAQVPVEKGFDGTSEGYFIRYSYYAISGVYHDVDLEDGSYYPNVTFGNSMTNLSSIGQWYFLASVWDGTNWRLYVNGVLVDTKGGTAAAQGAISTGAPLYVGAAYIHTGISAGPDRFFNGSIHDVGIYRRALTADEVKTNFLNTELNANVSVPDLLYYKMTAAEALQISQYNITLTDYSSSGAHTGNGVCDSADTGSSSRQYWLWTNNVAGLTNALHFNGASTILTAANSSSAFNFTSSPFSVNMWVSPESKGGYLIQNNGVNNGWYIRVNSGDYVIHFGLVSGSSSSSIYGGSVANLGWTMVTCVWDGTSGYIFINGAQVPVSGSFAAPGSSSSSLVMGVDAALTSDYIFDGQIWLPQIWSSALTATDIANLYFQQVRGVPWP